MRSPARHRAGRLALGAPLPWWHGARRRGRWLLAAAAALVAAIAVADLTDHAADTVAQLGVARPVAVARRDLDVGQVITGDDLEVHEVPVGLVPADAGATPDDVVGRAVTATIGAGEMVSRRRVAPGGLSGVAALVPDGRRAVALPTAGTGVSLQVGDRVDVLAPDAGEAYGSDGASGAERVAAEALVVASTDAAVIVAVEERELDAVAAALGRGTPVLALLGAR